MDEGTERNDDDERTDLDWQGQREGAEGAVGDLLGARPLKGRGGNAAQHVCFRHASMTSTLNYNIRWIEQTFHSLSLTESLLSPERESGNLTTNDYELAIRFLPGFHRHYRVQLPISLPIILNSLILKLRFLGA